MNDTLARIERGNYLSLATRKRSGDFVATPVWFASGDGAYYVFAAADSGKVKRLRNFSQARIAPCTVTGKLTGDWVDVEAHLFDSEAERATALAALRRKYWFLMRVGDFFARLSGRYDRRAYIRVDLPGG
ncbi:MAG: PPOX class F420-dependent oxidoreductase [Parahaliea sp.]